MTCKECIHYDVCEALESNGISKVYPSQCGCCKPKSRFIELPCEEGQKVYWYNHFGIIEAEVTQLGFVAKTNSEIEFDFSFDEIGKTVFFAKEEAEKALEERNMK